MSARLRILLLGGCLGIALLYGPTSGPLLAKGLRGPYVEGVDGAAADVDMPVETALRGAPDASDPERLESAGDVR